MKEITSIEIHYYKPTGKWYTSYTETLPPEVRTWETNDIVKWISEQKFHITDMPYTFETNGPDGMNKRLVL